MHELITYTEARLKEIIENHKHWLYKDCKGWESMRADLCYVNLSRANLRGVNLCSALLKGADLFRADLYGADLQQASLCEARLFKANLRGTNMRGIDLCRADLRKADLYAADLSDANLFKADLFEANLHMVNLHGTNINSAFNIPYIPMECPDVGDFIAWKKCRLFKSTDACIVKLLVPEDAERSSATGRKCRASKVKVLEIQDKEGNIINGRAISIFPHNPTIYTPGEIVVADQWDNFRYNECSHGIHFFINRQEAVDY